MNLSYYNIYNLNGNLLDFNKNQSYNLYDLKINITNLDKGLYYILLNLNGKDYYSNFFR